jgi:hypothetical protein
MSRRKALVAFAIAVGSVLAIGAAVDPGTKTEQATVVKSEETQAKQKQAELAAISYGEWKLRRALMFR